MAVRDGFLFFFLFSPKIINKEKKNHPFPLAFKVKFSYKHGDIIFTGRICFKGDIWESHLRLAPSGSALCTVLFSSIPHL